MRNYKLSVQGGRVRYIMPRNHAKPFYGETPLQSAEWMLQESKPFWSQAFDGYPIGVKVSGTEYYFSGEWE